MKNEIKIRLLTALTLIIVFVLVLILTGGKQNYEYVQENYIVRSGDTLWHLSGEHCSEKQDRREWIDAVAELNGNNADIKSGEEIIILVEKK